MVSRRASSKFSFGAAFIILGAIVVALFLGLFAVFLPWTIIVPMVVMPLLIALAVIVPELGVVVLLAAIFGAVPPVLLPNIPLAGGSLRPEDLGIAAFMGLLLIKRFGTIRQRLAFLAPYLIPLGLLGVFVIISAVYAYYYKRIPVRDIFNEVRPYYYWLVLIVIPLAVDGQQKLKRFMWFLLGLAIVLAAGMILQSFAGVQIFQRGSFRDVYTLDESARGVIRSTTPGMFLMAGALIFMIASFVTAQKASTIFRILAGVVLALGVLVGFGRGLWMSVILGVLVLTLIARFDRYLIFALISLIVSGVALVAVGYLKPDYLRAAADRALSVAPELQYGTSFGRRNIENSYALERVMANPFVGAGIGAPYKPPTSESRGWDGETRYIHNSYVNVAAKLGVPGLLAMLWLVGLILRRAWKATRTSTANKALAFSIFWTLLTVTVFTSITQPNIISTGGVATLCAAIFLLEHYRWQSTAPVERKKRHG